MAIHPSHTIRYNKLPMAIVLIIGTLLLFLFLGHRSHHHWDEFGYMYAAANFTPAEIVSGHFEASNINGFFNAKIGHVILLRFLFGCFGRGISAIQRIQAVYTALIIGSGIMLAIIVWVLWGNYQRAQIVGLLFLLIPVTVYTGPKMLSEVPGLFGGICSLMFFVFCLKNRNRGLWTILSLASAIVLVGSILARGNMLLMVSGGWLALFVVRPRGLQHGTILIAAAATGVFAIGLLFCAQKIFGLDLLRVIHSVAAVTDLKTSWRQLMWVDFFAFGPYLLVLPIAVVSAAREEFKLFGIWLVCSILPLVIGLDYMEERFLIGGAPAIAGLALLGGETVWLKIRKLSLPGKKIAGICLVGMILASSNYCIQPRMTAYEVDTAAYENVMSWIRQTASGRQILVPWSWSDYHYLRLAYPEEAVYLVNNFVYYSPVSHAQNAIQWVDKLRVWYGDRYIGNMTELEQQSGPWLFLCWETSWGGNSCNRSWIWDDPKLQRKLIYQYDRYRVYLLEKSY